MSLEDAHAQLTAPGARYEVSTAMIGGVQSRVWKNAPTNLREVFEKARACPNREFLIYQEERVTFAGFERAAIVLARRLQRAGLKKGDRVALAMRNLPEWPVAFFAIILAGGVATPLNAWWTGRELAYGIRDSGSRFLIVDDERLERLRGEPGALKGLEELLVCRGGATTSRGCTRLEEIIGAPRVWADLPRLAPPDIEIEPDDAATILYTSGTTGLPKGALGTHRNIASTLVASSFATARMLLRAGKPLPDPDPLKAPPRINLLVIPLFHVTGLTVHLMPALVGGGTLVLMHRWDPEEAMRLIERERVTATGGVPTIAWQLIEHPARQAYDLSSLTSVAYGGAPSPPELVQRISEVFPAAQAGNGYGMTETTATVASHVGAEYFRKPESTGPVAPAGEAEIRDPADGKTVLPTGAVGELWVRGPQVVKGYWNKPEATAETFVDGWLRTGDLARLDDEGFLFIIDRAKDMLIRGGENIYCVEVENVLYEHPDVMDAALIGLPHKTLGEEPAAVVHLRPRGTATEQELKDFVRSKLAAFKVPVKVAFWPETLPRNANGKIMKGELKGALAAEAGIAR
jgi:long-chain acyl-CoA synthetase